MTLVEFAREVEDHNDLKVLGATEDDEVLVHHSVTGIHALELESILSNEWQDLEAVLTGKKNGLMMLHMSRIVGYFSWHQNWNRSKLAELRDRHKGDYGVSAAGLTGLSTPVELPIEVIEAFPDKTVCKINEKSS